MIHKACLESVFALSIAETLLGPPLFSFWDLHNLLVNPFMLIGESQYLFKQEDYTSKMVLFHLFVLKNIFFY